MCHAALIANNAKKTAVIGTSTLFFGVPPSAHVVGRYGGPGFYETLESCAQYEHDITIPFVRTWCSLRSVRVSL
jgi:hypothetical protein